MSRDLREEATDPQEMTRGNAANRPTIYHLPRPDQALMPSPAPAVPVTCGCGDRASSIILDPRGPYFFCGRSKCRPSYAT